MKDNKQVARAAGTIGFYTLISRILGYVRDTAMANYFGSGMVSDVFIAAFRLPNMMRKLLAEGSLVMAFVPVFTDHLEKDGEREAFRLAESALGVLSIILIILTVLGIIFSYPLLRVMAPGFMINPEKMALAVQLTRILLPYMFFICLVGLCMGILNAMGHFTAPVVAPIILNVFMILCMWAGLKLSPDNVYRIKFLSWGVIAGGVVQLAIQIPFLVRYGFRLKWSRPLFHPGLLKIGKMIMPSIIGAGAYQINIVVGTILASMLLEGSITWLYYADRIFQFPLGIFAISMGTAILPNLSRQAASGNMTGLKDTLSGGLCFVMFITLPATMGLVVLCEPIVSLLFKRGCFGEYDLAMTSQALLFYTIGLLPVSAVRVVAPVFYARQDAKTPMKIAILSIILKIVFSIGLMGVLKHSGLALAATLSSCVNFILLLLMLWKQIGPFGSARIIKSGLRSLICSMIMGVLVHGLALYLINEYNGSHLKMAFGISVCMTVGILVYMTLSYLMKSPELQLVLSFFEKR